jgi:hypothetical protein
MQEAHTRSANRALVQMRINSVAHAPELDPRVMLERALRGRLFNAGARYSLGMFWGVAESKLSRANLYMRALLHVTLTPQEMELYIVRRESGKE